MPTVERSAAGATERRMFDHEVVSLEPEDYNRALQINPQVYVLRIVRVTRLHE